MNIIIDSVSFEVEESDSKLSLLEFAFKNDISILALCYLPCGVNRGKCGLCRVEVTDKTGKMRAKPACMVNLEDGLSVVTKSESLDQMQKAAVEKLLDTHDFSCGKCTRKINCEFLKAVQKTRAKAKTPYQRDESKVYHGKTLTIDSNKCILCSRCAATCSAKTRTNSIALKKEDFGRAARPSGDTDFDESNCLLCGQCIASCPVAALDAVSHIDRVELALKDEKTKTVVAIAPAVRTALGELFRLPLGTDVTGKIYTSLRELGFDNVFDLNFAADVTIMEESAELISRIENGGPFPMFTSCCPGWIRQVENFFPEYKNNISTVKSPQQIFGAAVKSYFAEKNNLKAENVFVATIVPCTAKKAEADRSTMQNDGVKNVDAVLTTRELAQMLESAKIRLPKLEDSQADKLMGEYSGAGTLFGVSGGVVEAAIRTAKDTLTGEEQPVVDYCEIRGFKGIKESEVRIGDTVLKVAAIDGAANLDDFVKSGEVNNYHFVEVMACEAGCIGGGGQPHISAKDQLDGSWKAKRASVLYSQDENAKIRKSHENEEVKAFYSEYFEKPLSEKSHKYLHHKYE
ncbi:MAG: [FeFe] hydrogenase, group A [Bifidobacteriaceae bacterium]|jgi:NADH-quinone oxidoreductase subunit G|nr:[FeFe] hydrogenase, group A [Bifidobacteriaceae bacterium]